MSVHDALLVLAALCAVVFTGVGGAFWIWSSKTHVQLIGATLLILALFLFSFFIGYIGQLLAGIH